MSGAASGGLVYLAGQVVSEYEVRSPVSSPRSGGAGGRRPLEEALTALRKGALLLKHGRHGKPKVHFFRLGACDTLLRWRGASGSVKQVRLRNVTDLTAGQATEVFRRCPLRPSARSFSLHYKDEDGSARTLDLTCADEQQYELWLLGLRVVADRLRTLGTPVAAAAAGGGTSGGGAAAAGLLGAGAGPGGLSPAELVRCAGARSLQRQGSAAVAVPAVERVPCDLLAWGSAQRAPPAPSLRSVMGVGDDCWQRRAAPALAPGGGHLDAYRGAVGRKHGALVTATGALYTWGEGRGGKLGLGHDQDQSVPQRVRHGLEGQCVVAVACGDDCTAALTDGGDLFMWGRLHAVARPQLVPLHVRGELRGRRVVQISCGPFHCAALTAEGQLFTWGEGFGGKLGHGDQGSRAAPALVAAFAGRQVLGVACGVWHTAAIVADPEGSPYAAHLHALQASPLRGEGGEAGGEGGGGHSPMHHHAAPHHHRNNSTSSAFSEASIFHDGQGGALYTWGGVNESVAFGSSEKHDSNKGCLGHGEADLYRGQLLPTRVGGVLEGKQVRHVAAGSHLTLAVTTSGRVYQMGVTGASSAASRLHCPWEGATTPELVRGALQGYFIDEVACGMHHAVALGRPLTRAGRPQEHAPRAAFAWGRGSEGQLGVRACEDSAAPMLVEGLKGRQVLQVAAGGSNTVAVCEHNPQRWEPDSREEAEAVGRALAALCSDSKPPSGRLGRAATEEAGGGAPSRRESERGGGLGLMRRSLSIMTGRASSVAGSMAAAPPGHAAAGPPNLHRSSSGSVHSLGGGSVAGSGRGGGGPPSLQQASISLYSFSGKPQVGGSLPPPQFRLQRLRSDRTSSGPLGGSEGGPRVVSLGSPAKSAAHSHGGGGGYGRRHTHAGGGGAGGAAHLATTRSFTGLSGGTGAASFGRASDMSSLSSWHHQRAHSDDGRGGAEHEADSGGLAPAHADAAAGARMLSSSDLASALDDMRSGSSSMALQDELAEKNRIIERLQRKLEKMQVQAQRAPAATAAAAAPAGRGADAERRLRESVQLSAGAFRALQQVDAGGGGGGGGLVRPHTSPPAVRPSTSPSASRGASPTAGGLAGGRAAAASADAEADHQTQLAAMQQMLAKKEAHLEGQQAQLAAWAAELQRREAQLAAQQARLEGRAVHFAVPPGSAGSSPLMQPIPSDSPLLPGRGGGGTAAVAGAAAAAAAASPLVRRALGEAAGAATPPDGGGVAAAAGSGGGTPTTPALAGEWQEEFEEGVHLTYTTSEGGATKLKRIRFSRTLFTAESAKQWYEANKHLLAQPTGGTPRSAALLAGSAAGADSSAGSASQPGTPQAAPAGQPAAAQQQQGQQGPAADPSGLLHFRQTSRNLSFDARELASFHDRMQALAAQQGGGSSGGGGASAGLPPAHRGPSRLSQVSRPSTAAPEGEAAAAAAAAAAELGAPPGSPFAAPAAQGRQQAAAAGGLCASVAAAAAAQEAADGAAQSQPPSRTGSGAPSELAAAAAGSPRSGGSSPIRASRRGSPLSKQPSAAASLAKQGSLNNQRSVDAPGKAAPLFTPRDKQAAAP